MSKEYDEVWTAELTAHSLGVSPASISHYLRVEEAARTDETVAKAATLDAAVKRMKVVERTQARIEAVKKDNAEVLKRAQHILSKGDCRDWIDKFPDEGADLCNFDPPWGGDISHRVQEHNESFDDSTEYADKLIDEMLPQIYRVLRPDRFMIFWIDSIRIEELKERCRKVGFNFTFTEQACIWFKPDKTNSHNRYPEKQPHSVYEQFLLCRKGDPIFYDKPVLNVFPYNRVSRATQIHPTEKPIELCQRLVKLCTVPGEVLIDPTAGSSAFLDAAIRSNRKAHGCELSDSYYDRGIARLASYLETFTPA
jgi:site-specific DNA-methyltransferase (adenine-specific)